MHFLRPLIIVSGFALVVCFGLLKVIWDLSEMSAHAPPQMPATPNGGTSQAEEGRAIAKAAYESIAAELEWNKMTTMIEPAEYPIVVDGRRRSQFVTNVFGALGCNMRVTMRTMSAEIERRFATFAGLPYQDPVSRQQWEQVWEADLEA
jgi:hypothetical protein